MPSPLRHPQFRLLLAARTTNTLGSAVAPMALAFAVLAMTGSATDLGLVVGANSLLRAVFLLYGGVLADRLPRGVILIGSSTLSALTQGTIAALVLTHHATIPLLVALAALNGTVSAFTLPAAAALTPQTVPPEASQGANALLRLGSNGAMVIGAPLGGLLIALTSPGWGLAADAATFAISGVIFAALRLPTPAVDRTAGRTGTLHELRLGWREFSSRSWLWTVVVGFMFINAATVASVNLLGPTIAVGTVGVRGWGLVLGAETLGAILGALVAMRVRVRRLLLFGVVCVAPLTLLPLALALAPNLLPLAVAGFVGGFCVEQFGVAWEVTMQQEISGDMLARVYSYDMLGSLVAVPIGQLAVGPIARVAGITPTILGAVAIIGVCTVAMIAVRGVRRLEFTRA